MRASSSAMITRRATVGWSVMGSSLDCGPGARAGCRAVRAYLRGRWLRVWVHGPVCFGSLHGTAITAVHCKLLIDKARVAKLAAGDRFKTYTVWVRVPPGAL